MAHVSVITRTQNRPLLVGRAIDSVLAQTYADWEHIIVNDAGAIDGVREVVDSRSAYRGRARIVHREVSRGMEAASNAGLAEANGKLVVLLDDDDSWEPRFLEAAVGFLEAHRHLPKLRGVITHSDRIAEELAGNEVRVLRRDPWNTDLREITLLRAAIRNPFPINSFVFERAVVDEIGPYREDLPVLGDWDFNLRFLMKYDIGIVPERLANYHHRWSSTDERYGNTIIDRRTTHELYDAMVRNEYLRADLASGATGLGHLTQLGLLIADLVRDARQAIGNIPAPPPAPPTLFSYIKDKLYDAAKQAGIISPPDGHREQS